MYLFWLFIVYCTHLLGVAENASKNILNIFDCNLKKDYQILIILVRIFMRQRAIK